MLKPAVSIILIALIILYLIIVKKENFHFYKKNTLIYWGLIIFSVAISYFVKMNPVFIYVVLFVFTEMAYYATAYGFPGFSFFDENERVESSYDWFNAYMGDYRDKAKVSDLSEGYFKGDFNIPLQQAVLNKFDYFYEQLKLQPGMKVLDIGCGYGQWMEYLRGRGVQPTGFTLSGEQCIHCQSCGHETYKHDARVFRSEFAGKFDVVSCLGPMEHFAKCNWSEEKTNETYRKTFETYTKYLNQNSTSHRLLISCIQLNDGYKRGLSWYVQGYFLDRHYSGRYPHPGQFMECAKPFFNRVSVSDQTEDYRYISIIDPKHFGLYHIQFNTWKKIVYLIHMFIADPFAIHKWCYHLFDSWMWQFGGTSKQVITTKDTPFRLYWEIFEMKK